MFRGNVFFYSAKYPKNHICLCDPMWVNTESAGPSPPLPIDDRQKNQLKNEMIDFSVAFFGCVWTGFFCYRDVCSVHSNSVLDLIGFSSLSLFFSSLMLTYLLIDCCSRISLSVCMCMCLVWHADDSNNKITKINFIYKKEFGIWFGFRWAKLVEKKIRSSLKKLAAAKLCVESLLEMMTAGCPSLSHAVSLH